MNRLTDKEGIDIKSYTDGIVTKNHIKIINEDEVIKKLHQIEDIEKEFGIDLILSVNICKKANSQKYVYMRESYGVSKLKFLDDLDVELFNHRLYVNSRGMWTSLDLKDYGKTWALTRKELEEDAK